MKVRDELADVADNSRRLGTEFDGQPLCQLPTVEPSPIAFQIAAAVPSMMTGTLSGASPSRSMATTRSPSPTTATPGERRQRLVSSLLRSWPPGFAHLHHNRPVRIVQVVTYVSRDGAFGGPVAVAVSQAVESARQGHEVTLVAGWDGLAVVDAPGVNVKLFRARWVLPKRLAGFSGLVSPGLQAWLRRNRGSQDVLHFQLARDLVTLPAASSAVRAGHPGGFVQAHGMIVPDARLRSRIFDRVAVRRVLRAASAVLAYPGKEGAQLAEVAGAPIRLRELTNGVEPGGPARQRGQVRDVLFMARLEARKRVQRFLGAALMLGPSHPALKFAVVGPDQGELAAVEAFIAAHPVAALGYEGAVAQHEVRPRLSEADVFVLPSDDEPFPITALDALAVGTPTIVTDTCGIAGLLLDSSAALVVSGTTEAIADGIQRLVADDSLRSRLSLAGPKVVAEHFSIAAVVTRLLGIYRESTTSGPTV